jgi:cytochrome c oxidase assembly factor CtaG
MRSGLERARGWLALVGALAVIVVLVPPVGTAAKSYVYVQAAQFAVLAVAGPALIVLGSAWRVIGGPLTSRLAIARSHRPSGRRSWLALVLYLALIIGWRLPVTVDALVRHPVLTVAEAVTLLAAGCGVWLELVDSPPFLPRVSRPVRAVFAALPMWTIWASAYIMAFSHTAFFTVYAGASRHHLGIALDQQLAAGLLVVIPGLCCVPVVYFSLITWLRESSYPDDLRRGPAAPAEAAPADVAPAGPAGPTAPAPAPGAPRPPRGWRAPLR